MYFPAPQLPTHPEMYWVTVLAKGQKSPQGILVQEFISCSLNKNNFLNKTEFVSMLSIPPNKHTHTLKKESVGLMRAKIL